MGTSCTRRSSRQMDRPSLPGSSRSSSTRRGFSLRESFERAIAARLDRHAQAVLLEVGGGELGQAGVVFDQQDVDVRGVHRTSHTCRVRRSRRRSSEPTRSTSIFTSATRSRASGRAEPEDEILADLALLRMRRRRARAASSATASLCALSFRQYSPRARSSSGCRRSSMQAGASLVDDAQQGLHDEPHRRHVGGGGRTGRPRGRMRTSDQASLRHGQNVQARPAK